MEAPENDYIFGIEDRINYTLDQITTNQNP